MSQSGCKFGVVLGLDAEFHEAAAAMRRHAAPEMVPAALRQLVLESWRLPLRAIRQQRHLGEIARLVVRQVFQQIHVALMHWRFILVLEH